MHYPEMQMFLCDNAQNFIELVQMFRGLKMSYWYGYGFGRGGGRGYGIGSRRGFFRSGNPSAYCRWYPNMPRGWWRMPPSYWEQMGITPIPASGVPQASNVFPGWDYPVDLASDKGFLKSQIDALESQLEALKKRLTELDREE
ncbi:MAG: hypothetical protein ACFFCZ_03150 [Promethearchaeota archaeon]